MLHVVIVDAIIITTTYRNGYRETRKEQIGRNPPSNLAYVPKSTRPLTRYLLTDFLYVPSGRVPAGEIGSRA